MDACRWESALGKGLDLEYLALVFSCTCLNQYDPNPHVNSAENKLVISHHIEAKG